MPRIVVETGGTDWLTPLATLLAVLVGGLVSWYAQSKLAEHQARLARDADEKASKQLIDTGARAAARVLQSDLLAAGSRLGSMLQRGERLPFHTLTPMSWGSGQSSLAKRLDPEAWSRIAEVAVELRAIDDMMNSVIADRGGQAVAAPLQLGTTTVERLEVVWQDTTDAYNLLADVAGTSRVAGRLHAIESSASRTLR